MHRQNFTFKMSKPEARYKEALNVIKACLRTRVAQARRSVETVRGNLYRNYDAGDIGNGRANIEYLTQIYLQEAGFQKVMNEVETLEQNVFQFGKKGSLSSDVQLAIDRLNAVGQLDNTNAIKKQMAKFPPPRQRKFDLSREVTLLFCGQPTGQDVSKCLRQLSEEQQIPLDFLEKASGRKASDKIPQVLPEVPVAPIVPPAPEPIPTANIVPPAGEWPGYGAPPAYASGYQQPPPQNPYSQVPPAGSGLPRY